MKLMPLRRGLVTALTTLPLTLLPPFSGPALAAADLECSLSVALLLQFRAAIAEVDEELFDGLLAQPSTSPMGVKAKEGDVARTRIRKLLKSSARPRLVLDDLGDLPRRLGSRQKADVLLSHARESEENLAAVLEYDAVSAYKKDQLGNEVEFMRRDELDFAHRALRSAERELAEAVECFNADDRREAARLLGDSAYAAGATRESEANREAAIAARLLALPDPKGTVLTRGDLQSKLDAKYREDLKSGRTSLSVEDD